MGRGRMDGTAVERMGHQARREGRKKPACSKLHRLPGCLERRQAVPVSSRSVKKKKRKGKGEQGRGQIRDGGG